MKHIFDTDLGALLLRLSLGTVLLAHSLYLKVMVYSLPGTAQYFSSIGLPSVLAYIVVAIEVVAGVALLLGFHSRFFAALVLPVLLGATWVHATNGWLFSNAGGGWEFPVFLLIAALVQICLGDGRYSLNNKWLNSDLKTVNLKTEV